MSALNPFVSKKLPPKKPTDYHQSMKTKTSVLAKNRTHLHNRSYSQRSFLGESRARDDWKYEWDVPKICDTKHL